MLIWWYVLNPWDTMLYKTSHATLFSAYVRLLTKDYLTLKEQEKHQNLQMVSLTIQLEQDHETFMNDRINNEPMAEILKMATTVTP